MLYLVPIWIGLRAFGLAGALVVATSSTMLFYISNYLVDSKSSPVFWFALLLTYGLFILFCFAAQLFLLNQKNLFKTHKDLEFRLAEVEELYGKLQLQNQQMEEMHQQNLKFAVTEERNRLAREIHDVLAQGFLAIIVQIEASFRNPDNLGSLKKCLVQVENLARLNLKEARRSVANLRPLPLDATTLIEALETKVKNFGTEKKIGAKFLTSGLTRRLSPEVEDALFRISQEALANVARHAQADQIQVLLDFEEDEVFLTIQDNGRGFSVPAEILGIENFGKDARTFGLSSMQERATLVGGLINIESSLGQGCFIRVSVPNSKAREEGFVLVGPDELN